MNVDHQMAVAAEFDELSCIVSLSNIRGSVCLSVIELDSVQTYMSAFVFYCLFVFRSLIDSFIAVF